MDHVFIAYSRKDFYFAESLFYALQSTGVDAWMDVWKITPGDDWDDAITQAIRSSQGIILIATKESLQSPYVKDEICRAYQAEKPIYLVVRGNFSPQDLLISHEYPKGTSNRLSLSQDVRIIVDMRADFPTGLRKITDAVAQKAVTSDTLPSRFNYKRENILSIPPIIVFLSLFMAITAFWKYGVGAFYTLDQPGPFMSYLRDILHGAIGEVLFLVPTMIGSIVALGGLVNILIFGFNFSRRKRTSANHLALLFTSAIVIGLIILFTDSIVVVLEAITPVLIRDEAPLLLLIIHGICFLLIVILGIVFRSIYVGKGRGAILRWLPTGYAIGNIRQKGNATWISNLPNIMVSPGPSYRSYCIVASPEDASTAQKISAFLQQRDYIVTDNRMEAECDLIILSPFADASPLRKEYKALHSKPIIYVLARSIRLPKDTSIAIQWIDFRQPTDDQFVKQWERHFKQLKSKKPVFPYVPEAIVDSLVPPTYMTGIMALMMALVLGCALAIAGMEYVVFASSPVDSLLLGASMTCLLGAMSLSYAIIAQMLRGVISSRRARGWFVFAGILTAMAALLTRSPLLIFGGLGLIYGIVFAAKRIWPSFDAWLPQNIKKKGEKSQFRPISNYKVVTSTAYGRIMIAGFLGINALLMNFWVIPHIPLKFAAHPYAVTVPGPYDLATPGLWSQDTFADAFGYQFAYHPDWLAVSQAHATAYPTWLKFWSVDASPMRFSPHFRSSIHVHFTNTEVQTDFGLVLNDFIKVAPSDLIGPQLRLSASGLWTIIEPNGSHYSGQIATNDLSHDYTLAVEVNGILCTYTINGHEITAIAEPSLSSVQDIMLSFANLASGGTIYNLSNFTYSPIPGPVLSREEAIKQVATLSATPYTTVAPGRNCNPNDGRWNSGYEPVHQDTALRCTEKGTQLNTSAKEGVELNFDNHAFGDLPDAFDYSFDATFQDTQVQCIELSTFATITTGIEYFYAFILCSNGNWAVKYVGIHTKDFGIFQNKQIQSGNIHVNTMNTIFVEFRSITQYVYVNKQLIASYEASDLKPSILFTNDHGPTLYSNFSYVPRTQH